MKKLVLCLVALFPSCQFMGSGEDIAIPVAEVEEVVTLAGQLRNFDYDQDGILRNNEVTAFTIWFGLQLWQRWAAPAATGEPISQPEPKEGT